MAYNPGNLDSRLLSGERSSIQLIFSYVLDWAIIILVAAVGGVLYKITGYRHAFSLEDPQISYPLLSDTVSITVVAIVACGAPAITILALSLLIPSSAIKTSSHGDGGSVWRRRLWEWHAGWLGLGLSLAGAFFVTSGLKDVVGKPRPDFLARCDPDLSNVADYIVGGLGLKQASAPIMVTSSICRNTDASIVKDGFAAFPSGHSSFSWAGLLYLTLWLSIKFAVRFPMPFRLTPQIGQRDRNNSLAQTTHDPIPTRSSATAPPLYLLLLVLSPIGVALYICATRYADYMHAGWDIMGGSLIGIFFAWFAIRWYHVPSHAGEFLDHSGWAWAPRCSWAAFGVPFGTSYVVAREPRRNTSGYEDLELGPVP
ncbi:hypothetical protein CBS147339_8578 [Penicillium roqueforti]|uniref:Phosphatidic acid phosphatase type 2/haloperoxidase n=1 Tax=Penicillium roqueforti (strain FM164) TaxID=1365484 RepID=W6Q626_PENRF|nr:hypothetical protein CBS147354_7748 [Penicillium roqueforti]CDM29714.1 Phosphatidic acid phosphatase type 2/haloperoxidase [Penicillium roqueforti FM164]KAI2734295.1 hypothetical protein DTO013F2_10343 [Penicillium roqueforti]KAI2765963.1 hypothetical protein DTO012A8_8817 [Penicillium roqueforti]KAI3067312.1 hypothetical protein CBS147339_8578 [Penicillium roqueforti]